MNLIILGPPASGKGTQAKMLAERFNLKHISSGDILRANSGNPKIRKYLENGSLVPDEIVFDFLKREMEDLEGKEGFILDGFPRTIKQAEMLDSFLKEKGMEIDRVIYLDVKDEEVIKRVSGRRVCPKCGATFNVYFAPPKIEGVCDRCKGRLIQREDDREEVVKKRLEIFKKETLPLLEYYKGKVITINGNRGISEIFGDICKALEF